MINTFFRLLIFLFAIVFSSCRDPNTPRYSREKPSLKEIVGIKFVEVRRTFDTGISFNQEGFQVYPERRFYLLSEDSIRTWSPDRDRYYNFKINFDHDSVFNMHEEWVRFKAIAKDSIIIQLLEVTLMKISGKRSNIFMTFYSEDYLKRKKLNLQRLRQPSRRDTMFILTKSDRANRDSQSVETSFPATQPAKLVSKVDWIRVERLKREKNDYRDDEYTDDFLYPTYNIAINRAYRDFNYSFSVLIDHRGNMIFVEPESEIIPEFKEAQIKIMRGIVDVYLRRLLKITPGKTLDIAHSSLIVINVAGKKRSG